MTTRQRRKWDTEVVYEVKVRVRVADSNRADIERALQLAILRGMEPVAMVTSIIDLEVTKGYNKDDDPSDDLLNELNRSLLLRRNA